MLHKYYRIVRLDLLQLDISQKDNDTRNPRYKKMVIQTERSYFSRSFMHRYFANHHAAATSQVLTNLVFLARRKDQPLDKSVFIRKEEKPSSIYQPCPGHYSLSFSPKPAFLSLNVRHSSWLVSLIVLVEHQSSNFTPIRHPDD